MTQGDGLGMSFLCSSLTKPQQARGRFFCLFAATFIGNQSKAFKNRQKNRPRACVR
ncbi:MAG: hypothetical protein U9N81_05740 [Bacillota bacterium]|nr:hypothetical protein [Bacillota bacterium]